MKRLISLLIGLCLISSLMVACGTTEETESESTPSEEVQEEIIEKDTAETSEVISTENNEKIIEEEKETTTDNITENTENENTKNITVNDGTFDPFEGLKIKFSQIFFDTSGDLGIQFAIDDSEAIYNKKAYSIENVDYSVSKDLTYGDSITVEVSQEYVDKTSEEIGAVPSRMTKDFIIVEGDYYSNYDEIPEKELNEKINSITEDIYEINKMTCTPPDWINVSGYTKLSFVGSGFKLLDNSVEYVGNYFFTYDEEYVEQKEDNKIYNEMYLVFHVDVSYYIPGSHCINQNLLLNDFYYVVELYNIKIDKNQDLTYWNVFNPENFSIGKSLFNGQEKVEIASFDIPNDDDYHYTWSLFNICPTLNDLDNLIKEYLSNYNYLTLVESSL